MSTDRRKFLQLLSTGALSGVFSSSIARALSIPANQRTGTIADVEHIVILMQENRSFDHYFGTLRGVRGFGDPRCVNLSTGNSVFYQPNGTDYVLPFHPTAPDLGLQFLEDLAHDWTTTHQAWNNGNNDQWVPSKGSVTMAYMTRNDIPYHYALADAFTICDANHCSLMGPTDPNRYYMWTGWVGNDGSGGGPVVDNAEAGYSWSTYPERLQDAGVSWKIYQDSGLGLDAADSWGWTSDPYIGNYGDNSLLYFHQYQNATPDSPLYQRARTGTDISNGGSLFDIFAADVQANQLPQVSWVVAPEAYTEHPNWPANYGAYYVSQILDALTANPDVWSKTALFITYDENDGFFDHMVPPTAPISVAQGQSTVDTTNEFFAGSSEYPAGPYGLGVRVPLLIVSPWSKGGWVNSEVFDHTSLIQFIHRRFVLDYPGLGEPNITPWRNAVTGDLTSAFNFRSPNDAIVQLPSTAGYIPPDNDRHPDYVPSPPVVQTFPVQEPGTRPARAIAYEMHVWGDVNVANDSVTIHFLNTQKTAVFQVRSSVGTSGPWTYTVGSNASLSDTFGGNGQTAYNLAVYGPNGFLRAFQGSTVSTDNANLGIHAEYGMVGPGLTLEITNSSTSSSAVRIVDAYTNAVSVDTVAPGKAIVKHWNISASYGWYDLTISVDSDTSFQRRLAGHVETGQDSVSDPLIAQS